MKPECVATIAAKLGEGPWWSASERAVWFVDIKGRRIHRFDAATKALKSWNAPEDVGFIVPATRGRMVCGLKSGLYEFKPASGEFALLTLVDSDKPRNRLNDAHVDAAGRLWFGTMDDDETKPTGSLYRFDQRGLRACDDDYVITNGPASSPDGRTLYHVDTLKRLIYAFDVDDEGQLSQRRLFTRIQREGGYPDGPVVDVEGCVWIALYGGWCVQRYSPQGRLLRTIEMPVANCTKPVFAGDDLRTMYITSAWKGLTDEQRAQQPLAGGLFTVRVDVQGLPQNELRYDD